MKYYDIHTHRASANPEEVVIVSSVIKEDMPANTSPLRSYGIHPWYIYNVDEQMEQLREYASLPETVAIGESGIDKLAATKPDIQQDLFEKQALLAEEFQKPLIIHCVKAWAELLDARKKISPQMPWIIHGFRGNAELAGQLIRQGFYLSFGKNYNPAALQAAWPAHILAETDDQPISIRDVYNQIALTLSLPLETVAPALAENSKHLLGLFK